MSLPIDGRVVHEIAMLLAYLDEDGSTLTAGVTNITGTAPTAATNPPLPRAVRDEASTTG